VARHLRPPRRWFVSGLALGGSLLAFDNESYPVEVGKVVGAAASRVDVALVSALRNKKKMSMVERLEIRAVRALLHAGVWSLLKKSKRMTVATAARRIEAAGGFVSKSTHSCNASIVFHMLCRGMSFSYAYFAFRHAIHH